MMPPETVVALEVTSTNGIDVRRVLIGMTVARGRTTASSSAPSMSCVRVGTGRRPRGRAPHGREVFLRERRAGALDLLRDLPLDVPVHLVDLVGVRGHQLRPEGPVLGVENLADHLTVGDHLRELFRTLRNYRCGHACPFPERMRSARKASMSCALSSDEESSIR